MKNGNNFKLIPWDEGSEYFNLKLENHLDRLDLISSLNRVPLDPASSKSDAPLTSYLASLDQKVYGGSFLKTSSIKIYNGFSNIKNFLATKNLSVDFADAAFKKGVRVSQKNFNLNRVLKKKGAPLSSMEQQSESIKERELGLTSNEYLQSRNFLNNKKIRLFLNSIYSQQLGSSGLRSQIENRDDRGLPEDRVPLAGAPADAISKDASEKIAKQSLRDCLDSNNFKMTFLKTILKNQKQYKSFRINSIANAKSKDRLDSRAIENPRLNRVISSLNQSGAKFKDRLDSRANKQVYPGALNKNLSAEAAFKNQYLKFEYLKNFKLKPVRKKSHLVIEIWTNGSLHPRQALLQSFLFLSNNFLKLQVKLSSFGLIGSMFKSEVAYGNLKYSIINNYNSDLTSANAPAKLKKRRNNSASILPFIFDRSDRASRMLDRRFSLEEKIRFAPASAEYKKDLDPLTSIVDRVPLAGAPLTSQLRNAIGVPLDNLLFESEAGAPLTSDLKNQSSSFGECEALSNLSTVASVLNNKTVYLHSSLKAPVGILNISLRAYTALRKARIFTLKDLIQYSRQDLLKIKNLGVKSVFEIETSLANLGFYLRCAAIAS